MSRGIEVELKVRAADLREVEEVLSGRARWAGEIDYTDTYYTFPGTEGFSFHRFRLRESGGQALITVKEKSPKQGGRAVNEYEFEVSDAEAFREFARIFGCRVMLRKRKRGRRYLLLEHGPLLFARGPMVELVTIDGLGNYVEIEIMAADPSQIPAAEARLKEVLRELCLPESEIEPRAYTALLYAREHGGEEVCGGS